MNDHQREVYINIYMAKFSEALQFFPPQNIAGFRQNNSQGLFKFIKLNKQNPFREFYFIFTITKTILWLFWL